MGAWRASLAARSNCANRSFAGATVPGHFAQPGPVLGRLVRAGPVPVHFAPPGPLLGDFARAGSVGAFSWAGPVLAHLALPVLGPLVRAVRARPVPLYLPRPPTLG